MKKLLWIDLEMTGLEVEKERIIEVAAIVTDLNFVEVETYHSVVKQDQKYIDGMDDWNRKHHGSSGLIAQIPKGKKESSVEDDLLALIDRHWVNESKPVLCGNTIHQDKKFIDRYMPRFSERIHYRLMDVSSWKVIFNHKYNIEVDKKNTHQAVEDIRESIMELKHYLTYVKANG